MGKINPIFYFSDPEKDTILSEPFFENLTASETSCLSGLDDDKDYK